MIVSQLRERAGARRLSQTQYALAMMGLFLANICAMWASSATAIHGWLFLPFALELSWMTLGGPLMILRLRDAGRSAAWALLPLMIYALGAGVYDAMYFDLISSDHELGSVFPMISAILTYTVAAGIFLALPSVSSTPERAAA